MAQNFLATHGIDLEAELDRIQHFSNPSPHLRPEELPGYTPPTGQSAHHHRYSTMVGNLDGVADQPLGLISNVSLHRPDRKHSESGPQTYDVLLDGATISSVEQHDANRLPPPSTNSISGCGALLAPSLCHPHIHLDKAFLLSHPRYTHLQPQTGDFKEAMSLTGSAKAHFEHKDLLERGQRVVDESVDASVTHMRAFVELDAGVGTKCLDAGVELKKRAEGRCVVQICAFAQLPLFTATDGDPEGERIRDLMTAAAKRDDVGAIGFTPYVEDSVEKQRQTIELAVTLAIDSKKHLDFHLDYNLDPDTEPMAHYVISQLHKQSWSSNNPGRTIVLGHCTRLSLFTQNQWRELRQAIGDLPVHFVGLPTSDLFMMRTPERTRGTLPIPSLIKDHGLSACMGINNIGNAFTPHGSCDPLSLACWGVGVYSAGTKADAEVLYEAVSARAKKAIGVRGREDEGSELSKGVASDLVLFGADERYAWRTRRSVSEAVWLYDCCRGRRGVLGGKLVT